MRPLYSLPFALATLLLFVCNSVFAQVGVIDSTFNAIDLHGGRGPDGPVLSIALQSNGKVIVGGSFLNYTGIPQSHLARTNTDGSLDMSFDIGTGTNGTIEVTKVQSDGKILIAGEFTSYNGAARNYIARLNTDGSLDTDLDPGTGANGPIRSFAVQADGKILIGGDFTTYGGTARNHIARINSDGSLDSDFNPGSGADGAVLAIAQRADGTFMIGGAFTQYDGMEWNNIAALNSDGSPITFFDPGTGTNGTVRTIAIQGPIWAEFIYIGGDFTTYAGEARSHFARISQNGGLYDFVPGNGLNGPALVITCQSDGTALVGGDFTIYNGGSRRHIARIHTDGSVDQSFNSVWPMGVDDKVSAFAVQSNGNIFIGGWFLTCGFSVRHHLVQVDSHGNVKLGFLPETGTNTMIESLALQSDGKILAGGKFSNCDVLFRTRIARMNSDGSVDPGFDPGSGADNTISKIAVQPDGKILIGGSFTEYNGTPRNGIARLNSDGSLDTGFDPGTGPIGKCMILQPDGKILINKGSYGIERLNMDGTLDTSFDPGTGIISFWGGGINSMALQPDGKIVIAGSFDTYNGTTRHRLARINSDGSLDTTLDPGTGPNADIMSIAVQPDGKIIIQGNFFLYNGTPENSIVLRINVDGSLDTGYNTPIYPGGTPTFVLVLRPDGKLLAASGAVRLLNSDGSLDSNWGYVSTFDQFGGTIYSMVIQPDNRVIIGGVFVKFNDTRRNNIARFLGGSSTGIEDTPPYAASALHLWPNPTEGDHVSLTMDGLDRSLRAVGARLYDATGREVLETTLTVTAGSINTSLDLGHADKGLYLLQLIAGEKIFSQRVVVGR